VELKIEKVTESPLKMKIKNSLKSIILKNLSEERTVSGLLRKESIKSNPYSEKKNTVNDLIRPFSQNTNLNNPRFEWMLDYEDKEKVNKDNKENKSIYPVKRRIIFNSFNIHKPFMNSNTYNLKLNDTEENLNALEGECYHIKKGDNDKRMNKHQLENNFNDKFKIEPCHGEELKENYLLSNI